MPSKAICPAPEGNAPDAQARAALAAEPTKIDRPPEPRCRGLQQVPVMGGPWRGLDFVCTK